MAPDLGLRHPNIGRDVDHKTTLVGFSAHCSQTSTLKGGEGPTVLPTLVEDTFEI